MKKAICILTSIIMVICLAGCTENISVKELKQLTKKEALNTADLSELGDISLLDYSCSGNKLAILYTHFENHYEDYVSKVFLTVFDMEKEKLKEPTEVDGNSFSVEFENGKIQVWVEPDVSVMYDTALNKLGKGNGKITDDYDIANSIDTIDTSRFICRNSYSYLTHYISNSLTVFYNDPGNYYISKTEQTSTDLCGFNKTILSYIFNDDKNVTLSVADYENKKIVNKLELTTENEKYLSISNGIIDENYAIFDTLNDDGGLDKLYYWRYNDAPLNTPFECSVINKDEFVSRSKAFSEKIYEKYGVYADINKDLSDTDYGHSFEDTEKDAKYLLCLYDLDYCLSTFPKELYTEILCNDIENAAAQFKNMKIFITGSIDEDIVSAFATNENDELITVYSASSFSYTTFCHELMHQLEYRIWNYEEDFDNKWEQLNPSGFYYTDDYSSAYEENEQYRDYFARDYGISNFLEDRATVFEMYHNTLHNDEEKWWLKHKPLNDKVNYLNDVLAKSFPSLNQ